LDDFFLLNIEYAGLLGPHTFSIVNLGAPIDALICPRNYYFPKDASKIGIAGTQFDVLNVDAEHLTLKYTPRLKYLQDGGT
jgi:hypothetical protein